MSRAQIGWSAERAYTYDFQSHRWQSLGGFIRWIFGDTGDCDARPGGAI